MRIGTDVNMSTNIQEGYLMMDYKVRELMPKGKLDPDVSVRFLSHLPDYVLEEQYGTSKPVGVKTILLDVCLSANDVWELYQANKEGIDSLCGLTHEYPTCPHSLLSLASDVDAYGGLE